RGRSWVSAVWRRPPPPPPPRKPRPIGLQQLPENRQGHESGSVRLCLRNSFASFSLESRKTKLFVAGWGQEGGLLPCRTQPGSAPPSLREAIPRGRPQSRLEPPPRLLKAPLTCPPGTTPCEPSSRGPDRPARGEGSGRGGGAGPPRPRPRRPDDPDKMATLQGGLLGPDPGALSPAQQEQLRDFKIQTRIANEKYLRTHKEVDLLISGFFREMFLKRPDNIQEFAADYFTDPRLPNKIHMQLIKEKKAA
uniref:Regulatory subunit of type II PKA R-subunit domain containing 1 n=4 Tax=Canidae TaxID=9608 RepID=A0A8I3PIG1_CANLF